jgi:drug/metabolite transporter (DMT)-like permease
MPRLPATLTSAPALALTAAALFGASTPVAKLLLDDVSSVLLASLLYLGSGLGLSLVKLVTRRAGGAREAALRRRDWPWLAVAVAAGGVVAPVLLMEGLARSGAASTALLLNLEAVFTALLAWSVFGEHVGVRIAAGMLAIVAGGAVLAAEGWSAADLTGPLCVAGACLGWAVDNNATRAVSGSDPLAIALVKGWIAGAVNLALAIGLGAGMPRGGALAGALALGAIAYGASLVLFVVALRRIGSARTGAYFSIAPFFGAAVAVAAFGEPVTPRLVAAGALMALGVYLHLTERHEHDHAHEAVGHEHRHVHDEHHRHAHDGASATTEPHSHWHVHEEGRHGHPHFPDLHHRHRS